FLKDFTFKGLDAESTKLAFRGLKQDGTATPITLEVSHVTYDEEPCIQFLARANRVDVNNDVLEAQIKQIKWQDVVTGLYNRQYMIDHLEKTIDNITEKDNLSLLYIDIDNFIERAQSTLGVAAADMALSDLASLLREKNNTTDIIARFGDTAFTV